MSTKILLVDDDMNVLAGYQRQLRRQFTIEVASSGADGLARIAQHGPYAVVVSDMRMPQMTGVEFLTQVRAIAPQTVRMMLTGNADQQTAIDAVNQGHIFRFLNKPCPLDVLSQALQAGLEQYSLITAEAELLNKTVLGTVGVLVEILGIVDPVAFTHARDLRNCVREVAPALQYKDRWHLELAALLCPIGRMTLPPDLPRKSHCGELLSQTEKEVLARVPEISHDLIAKIPRLGPVAQIVLYHTKPFQGIGFPNDKVSGEDIPMGARILKILSDLLAIEANNTPRYLAFRLMHTRSGWYDPAVLTAINAYYNPSLPVLAPKKRSASVRQRLSQVAVPEKPEWIEITWEDLMVGDVLASDLFALDGHLLVPAGSTITSGLMDKLKGFAMYKGIQEPILILDPGIEGEI